MVPTQHEDEPTAPDAAPTSSEERSPAALPAPASGAPQHTGRGFAALDPELVREIARRGGMAAHQKGRAHEFTTEEARAAGRKGALVHRLRRMGAPKPESG